MLFTVFKWIAINLGKHGEKRNRTPNFRLYRVTSIFFRCCCCCCCLLLYHVGPLFIKNLFYMRIPLVKCATLKVQEKKNKPTTIAIEFKKCCRLLLLFCDAFTVWWLLDTIQMANNNDTNGDFFIFHHRERVFDLVRPIEMCLCVCITKKKTIIKRPFVLYTTHCQGGTEYICIVCDRLCRNISMLIRFCIARSRTMSHTKYDIFAKLLCFGSLVVFSIRRQFVTQRITMYVRRRQRRRFFFFEVISRKKANNNGTEKKNSHYIFVHMKCA